jgi:uncharacterized hydrophobic protein (TIGR00271 family)
MQMDQQPPMDPPSRISSLGDLLHDGRVERSDLDVLRDKLFFDREPGRDPYVRFALLMVLSVTIATGGIVTDSTATVIGAMIVAPMMTPIMAMALAVVTGDGRRIGRALLTVLAGVAIAVVLSWFFAELSRTVVTVASNGQVSGRIAPRTADLIIALASGAAGAFALSRANVSDALPGVAIAISLVPPLSVVGVMIANGDPSAAVGAMLLFVTNLLAILVAGGGLLAIMGYGRAALGHRTSRERRRAAIVIALATLAVLVPLSITGIRAGTRSILETSVTSQVRRAIAGSPVELKSVSSTNDTVEVVLTGDRQRDQGLVKTLTGALHRAHPGTTVRVLLVQTEVTQVPGG